MSAAAPAPASNQGPFNFKFTEVQAKEFAEYDKLTNSYIIKHKFTPDTHVPYIFLDKFSEIHSKIFNVFSVKQFNFLVYSVTLQNHSFKIINVPKVHLKMVQKVVETNFKGKDAIHSIESMPLKIGNMVIICATANYLARKPSYRVVVGSESGSNLKQLS